MVVSNRKAETAIIVIISIGFIIWSAAFIYRSSFIAVDGKRYFCLFDDAMISMRYAWNFSHGVGLVWNPGEYVQGYTNLLMTLMMSVATWVFDKSIAVLFVQISGVIFMLVIAYASMRIADIIAQDESHHSRALTRVLAFFCALSYYPLAYWSLEGMETGLLAMLLLLGVLSALKYTATMKPISVLSMTVSLGLAYFTRNDSIIFAVLIWSYILLEIPDIRINRRNIYYLAGAIGLYSLFIAGQHVFQYLYYGELLSNTYTLKLTGMPLLARLGNGIGFVVPFLKETALVLVLSGVGVLLESRRRKLLLLSLVSLAVGYQIYIGGDPWNYWRIISPFMPLLTILFISAINAISNTRNLSGYFPRIPKFPGKYVAGILVISCTLIGLLSVNMRFMREISLLTRPYKTGLNRTNVNIAIVLNQLTTNDASVGVFAAGSIPYFTGRTAIDFLGKSDRYIANLHPDMSGAIHWFGMTSVPGHNKYDLNYSIKTLGPTYVANFKWGTQDLSQWARDKYVKVKYDGISLFLLKDSPAVLWDKVNIP